MINEMLGNKVRHSSLPEKLFMARILNFFVNLTFSTLCMVPPAAAKAADYGHCNNTRELALDAWLYHSEIGYFSSDIGTPPPIFEMNTDGTWELKKLDISTLEAPRDVRLQLRNAEKTRFKFVLSEETTVRIELIPENPGPHGELEISLFTISGAHFYLDFNNGMYRSPSWSTKYPRAVPRVDVRLPAGEYMIVLCNSYVADTGVMRIGRAEHEALTNHNPNPLTQDNDL